LSFYTSLEGLVGLGFGAVSSLYMVDL